MKRANLLSFIDRSARADLWVLLSLIFVGLFFVASGFVSYSNIRTLNRDSLQVAQTHDVLLGLSEVLSSMKDAETGQRGFIITGDSGYLVPYSNALTETETHLARLDRLMVDTPNQKQRLAVLKGHIASKMDELRRTLEIRRNQGFIEAQNEVVNHLGKNYMDAIRAQIVEMQDAERQRRIERIAEMERAYQATILSVAVAAILGVILTFIIATIVRRSTTERRRQEWLQAGQVGLSQAMLGEQRLDQLGKNLLSFMCDYTGAHAAAFYAKDGGIFKQVATFGVPPENDLPATFSPGDGLLGQAALKGGIITLENTPEDDALTIGTALGQWRPRHLAIAAAKSDDLID
ncbi:MAG: histidine kinase, partial [Asticcacaulis sp. 32-58-5]